LLETVILSSKMKVVSSLKSAKSRHKNSAAKEARHA
jgi:hypothetical protein